MGASFSSFIGHGGTAEEAMCALVHHIRVDGHLRVIRCGWYANLTAVEDVDKYVAALCIEEYGWFAVSIANFTCADGVPGVTARLDYRCSARDGHARPGDVYALDEHKWVTFERDVATERRWRFDF